MFVRVIEVQSGREAPSTRLFARSVIRSYGVESWPMCNPFRFDPSIDSIELRLRHHECVMLRPRSAPGSQLQQEVRAGTKHGERSVGSLQVESQNAGVESHAAFQIVDLQYDVI